MLKLAIQDLWDASDKKKFLVHQQGATCAEIGKFDDKPRSYVATLHFVCNQITHKIITVPTPTVPGGGGGGELVRAYFGKAKFGEGKLWYKILDTMEKCGTIFP